MGQEITLEIYLYGERKSALGVPLLPTTARCQHRYNIVIGWKKPTGSSKGYKVHQKGEVVISYSPAVFGHAKSFSRLKHS